MVWTYNGTEWQNVKFEVWEKGYAEEGFEVYFLKFTRYRELN